MNKPVEKHGPYFVGFVAVVVFLTAFINGYIISTELNPPALNKYTPPPQPAVLGETNSNEQPNYVLNQLLIEFKQDPKITFQSAIRFTVPFINQTVTLREEGLKSKTFGADINNIISAQTVKNTKEVFAYKNKASLQLFTYAGQNQDELARKKQELENNPNILSVSYNYRLKTAFVPNDPDYKHDNNILQYNFSQIKMPEAWDIMAASTPGQPVGIAVFDSGIAYEDYTDNYANCCWTSYGDCGTTVYDHKKCVDPGSVYKRSDDFSADMFLPGLDTFDECIDVFEHNPQEHPNDDLGHGTHVAATIAQTTNNNNRFAGMANLSGQPRVKIMPVKVADKNGEGPLSDLLLGFNYVKDYNANTANAVKIKVINLSLGFASNLEEPSKILHDAITDLDNQGVVMVASAGNDGGSRLLYPARYDEVISVGAVKFDNTKTKYSNYEADKLDLVAPGGQTINDSVTAWLDYNQDNFPDGIFQTTILPNGNDFTAFTQPNSTSQCIVTTTTETWVDPACGLFEGTSMAAPHISALVGIMLSIQPSLTPDEVVALLKNNAAKPLSVYTSQKDFYGDGLVDANAVLQALTSALVTASPTPTSTPQPTPTPDPLSSPTPTPTTDPNADPTPTPDASSTPTPAPTEPYCGDGICQEEHDENGETCYQDCCAYSPYDGDINYDCIINTSDWGVMWSYWTRATDL